MENVPIQDAVVRRFEINGYFGVDFKIVWDTANQTLPEFKKQIKSLLEPSGT